MDKNMPTIGFVLLTHANESQVVRLTTALNAVFDDPPIVCHHDFSQCAFEPRRFPGNVRFVRPHVETRWGTISLVQATLRGLQTLYAKFAPGWFYLLSGSDYPIRDGATVRSELLSTPYDAFIQLRKIGHAITPRRTDIDTGGLESPSYTRLAYQRYIARSVPIPSWRHPHRGPAAMHLHITSPRLLRPFHPFTEKFHCYTGSQWFAANSKAASVLLSPDNDRLVKYFKNRFPPDEAVLQTILGNASHLNCKAESKHFIDWERGHHPRVLNEADVPAMLVSDAHFARKFASGSRVLDVLDRHLAMRAEVATTVRAS